MVSKKEFQKKVQRIMRRGEEIQKEREYFTPEHKGLAGYIESVGLHVEHPFLTEKQILRKLRKDPVFADVIIMSKRLRRVV